MHGKLRIMRPRLRMTMHVRADAGTRAESPAVRGAAVGDAAGREKLG
jgi:hypothetical protein